MSSMAAEVAARMREDGIDPSQTIVPGAEDTGQFGNAEPGGEPTPGGAPFPGNEGGAQNPPPPPAPPAGAQNTETVVDGQDPGPIPYARFKEVNDRLAGLRGYEQLAEYGYDPDSLGRLAAFEAQYIRDPKTTIATLIDGLEDLPPEVKATISQHLGVEVDGSMPPGPGAPSEDGGGDSSGLSAEDRELLQWARERRATEQKETIDRETNQRLDTVVNAWKAKDTGDKIDSPPEHRLLAFVSAAAARGGYRTLEELADLARNDWLEERDRLLGGAVQGGRRAGTPPPALPGNGALPAPAQRPRSLAEASKLARAAMERGELPPITGG